MTRVWMAIVMMAFACVANAENFTGTYVGKTEDGTVVLTLRQDADGHVTGTLKEDGETKLVEGLAKGNKLTATGAQDEEKVPFTASIKGGVLTITVMGVALTLNRQGAAAPASPGTPSHEKAAPSRTKTSPSSGAAGSLSVKINGVLLTAAQLQRISEKYNLRFRSGDFWYDRRCGAWGQTGMPVSGVVAPNIDMGGKLRSDASNGDTGVFVNGRELPVAEVLFLQQLGTVNRGRAWLDANGNFGKEGGPVMNNLFVLARQRQVPRESILSTYDRTGLKVFGY